MSRPGETLTADEIMNHCKGMAFYRRPVHVALWPEDRLFPMNKSGKVDTMALIQEGEARVADLRRDGGWDRTA